MLDARQLQYLDALGIHWYRRRELAPLVPVAAPNGHDKVATPDDERPCPFPSPQPSPRGRGGERALPDFHAKSPATANPASSMQRDKARPLPQFSGQAAATPPRQQAAPAAATEQNGLLAQISACAACSERLTKRKVIREGGPAAPWLIIGIAPGVEASRHKKLVAGPTEQLQNAMFRALGVSASQLQFTSLVKCPATNNRRPSKEEQGACLGFLKAQIAECAPKIILCLGSKVTQALLETEVPIDELRGRIHNYGPQGIPLVVTYHPDWLLRHPEHKPGAWLDLQLARNSLAAAS